MLIRAISGYSFDLIFKTVNFNNLSQVNIPKYLCDSYHRFTDFKNNYF